MRNDVYWVDGPWPGKLAMSARPRGGDWLPDEIARWKGLGINAIFSLLTPDEERDLDLLAEAQESRRVGLSFVTFPIEDRGVPKSEVELNKMLTRATDMLSSSQNVLVHCRQGIGRSGLFAACLLVRAGMNPSAAVDSLSATRGLAIPETSEQRNWIERYATAMTK